MAGSTKSLPTAQKPSRGQARTQGQGGTQAAPEQTKASGSVIHVAPCLGTTAKMEEATPTRLGHPSGGSTKSTPLRPAQPRKPHSRFSLRRLFYTNPLLSPPFTRSSQKRKCRSERGSPGMGVARDGVSSRDGVDTRSEGSWVTLDRDAYSTSSSVQEATAPSLASSNNSQGGDVSSGPLRECPLCLAEAGLDQFPHLRNCSHLFCVLCLQQYVRIEIQDGRINLKCPQCTEIMHPNDIESLVGSDSNLLTLYESLMLRRVLAADPDTRWCPAPNCTYAVVASGCASCPKISCEKDGCNASFCYHCKADWHPNQTCDMARAQRKTARTTSVSNESGGGSELKVCPRCSVLIVKMDDGSCNHMTCAVCGSEFCWLCMKEISDLHYLSPSGCTFWGKKPWSRKKKLMWQLGTLVGAPVGIALIAGISIPAMIIGIPVWVGRKIHSKYVSSGKHQRNMAITGGVTASVLVSPFIACLAVSIGVPILLAYVYGVVPISLCRSGPCGVHTTTQVGKLIQDLDDKFIHVQGEKVRVDVDEESQFAKAAETTSSRVANPSIGEVSLGASLSMGSGSHLDRVGCIMSECDRESASNTAMAGASLTGSVASSYVGHQRLEVGADIHGHPRKKYSFSSERLSETVSLSEKSASVSLMDDGAASTRAMAGSLLAYRMENASVSSYRAGGQATPGSCGSQVTPGDVDSAIYPVQYSGDEISLRSMPGASQSNPRSLSPVSSMSGDELTAAIRRSRRRGYLDKQLSENSSLISAEDKDGVRFSVFPETDPSERVRFDDNVSFIEANSPDEEAPEINRLAIKKTELDAGGILREETAEELAQVVSPEPRRLVISQPLQSDLSAPSLKPSLSYDDPHGYVPTLQLIPKDSSPFGPANVCPIVHLTGPSASSSPLMPRDSAFTVIPSDHDTTASSTDTDVTITSDNTVIADVADITVVGEDSEDVVDALNLSTDPLNVSTDPLNVSTITINMDDSDGGNVTTLSIGHETTNFFTCRDESENNPESDNTTVTNLTNDNCAYESLDGSTVSSTILDSGSGPTSVRIVVPSQSRDSPEVSGTSFTEAFSEAI